MKKYIYVVAILFVALFSSCSGKKGVTINIAGLREGEVYVTYASPDMIDSRQQEEVAKGKVINGKCTFDFDTLNFAGKVKECTVTIINKDMRFGCNLPLPIEKGKHITLNITGLNDYLDKKSPLNVSFSGSSRVEDFSDFWQKINDSFAELSRNGNALSTYKKQVEIYKDYLEDYPESGYAYSILISEMMMIQGSDNPILDYCNEISNDKSDNPWQKYLIEAYKSRQMREVNASTLVFSAQTINKDTLTERDINKGKLLIVDFWASWCQPCLQAIPKLESLYNKYHSKGLEIVSISLDTNPQDWLKYVSKHPFHWTSLIGNGQQITQRYGFEYIPYVLVVNSDGKILKRGIKIEDLENFITSQLNK